MALSTPMSPGATGPQVLELQKFLNSKGFNVAVRGPGSHGQETDYFGPATEAALLHYQKAHGLPTHGSVDLATLEHVNTPDGQGGPGSSTQTNPASGAATTGGAAYNVTDPTSIPHFSGPYALIRISGEGSTPNSLFLVDTQDKQIFPFADQAAVQAAYPGLSQDEIDAHTTMVPAAIFNTGNGLSGYQLFTDAGHSIQDNGVLPDAPASDAALSDNYGQQTNPQAVNAATTALDGFSNLLESGAAGTTLGGDIVKNVMSNPTMVATYVNALAYGGYTLQDVYQDMLKTQNMNGGDGSLSGINVISPSVPASTYKASPAYQGVKTNADLNVSPTIAGLDSSVLSLPVLQIPQSAFQTVSPLTDPNSPQFQAAMEQYKSAAYESSLAMAQADNQVAHTQAEQQWKSFQSEIQARLGITLSDNAVQAWNQLNNFQQQAGQNNLGGSGIAQQQIDSYLKQQMGVNQSMRSYYQTYEDQEKQAYYQAYASPQEIQDLIAQDKASGLPQDQWKSVQWGLAPSSEVQSYLSLANLQKMYPTATTAELQGIINQYVDPNGNYYSQLYGKYAANADKYSNSGGTAADYAGWQQQQVEQASENKAQNADDALPGQSTNQFVQPTGGNAVNSGKAQPTTSTNMTSAAASALTQGNPFGTNPAGSTSATTPQTSTPTSQTSTPVTPTKTTSTETNPNPTYTGSVPVSTISAPANNSASLSVGPSTAYPSLSGSSNASAISGASLNNNSTPATQAPTNNPYITANQKQTSSAPQVTSGSGTGLGGVVSSVGNFFKNLF